MARRLLLPPVLVIALLVAGCGGSSGSDTTATEDWANNLCSAVTTWKSSVTEATDNLKSGNVTKDSLKQTADDLKSATNTFANDLEDLGTPDTQAGQQAKDAVDKLSGQIQNDVDDLKSNVDKVSNVGGALSAVSAVSAIFTTMGQQITTTFNEIQGLDAKGELQDAFKQADSCQGLTKPS